MLHVVYRFGPFTVDTGAHVLLREGSRIAIQEQPFQVLLTLLESAGQVVTREALRTRLWGTDTFVDFDQSLNSAVRRLRLALEDNSRVPIYVETIPRVGFRFIPDVTLDTTTAVSAKEAQPVLTQTLPAPSLVVEPELPIVPPPDLPPNPARPDTRHIPSALAGAALLTFLLGMLLGVLGRRAGLHPMATPPVLQPELALDADPPAKGARLVRVSATNPLPSWHSSRTELPELQGWYHLQQRTQADYVAAARCFETVLSQRPANASAMVGLGQAEVLMALNGDLSRERLRHARALGQQALSASPHLAAAHTLIGAADALADWNDAEAEQEFQTALHLDPADSLTHLWFAVFVLLPRQDYRAAEHEATTAVQQDPLSLIAHTDLGWILYSSGKRDAALDQYRFVLQLNPNFVPAKFHVRQMLAAEGRQDDGSLLPRTASSAAARLEEAAATTVDASRLDSTGVCAEAARLSAGATDGRLPVLRAAVEDRCPTAYFFGQDPGLRKLKSNPAFTALLQSAHLAHNTR